MTMTRAEYSAKQISIEAEWPNAHYPGMHSALVADLDREYRAASTPPRQQPPPRPAPQDPIPAPASKKADSERVSPSEAIAARNQRIGDGLATDADLEHMTAAQLRDHIATNHEGALSTPKYMRTLGEILAAEHAPYEEAEASGKRIDAAKVKRENAHRTGASVAREEAVRTAHQRQTIATLEQ